MTDQKTRSIENTIKKYQDLKQEEERSLNTE